jgi:hypothetical protein
MVVGRADLAECLPEGLVPISQAFRLGVGLWCCPRIGGFANFPPAAVCLAGPRLNNVGA